MKSASRSVLVAGGGIAGLTAALCLARVGYRVDVFEQVEGFTTIGAGLQISPNAFHVLAELGLSTRLKEAATGPLSLRIMAARSGTQIASIPLGAASIDRYRAPYLVIHRADLHQILARAAHDHPDISLHLDARLEEFSVHPNGVTALVYRSGRMTEHPGIAVIAADGVWSSIRTRCFNLPPAAFTGLVAWRGLLATDQLPGSRDLENVQLWLADNAHAVTYPVRGGRHLNMVVIARPMDQSEGGSPDRSWNRAAVPAELRTALTGWHPDMLSLLDYRTRWSRWPLFETPGTGSWARGPAVLIGDAAHAMLPFAAQGAAMAIEDAAELAFCLAGASADDMAAPMVEFTRRRRRRVTRAKRLAKANRFLYHLPAPFSIARNIGMALLGGQRLLARQDWLYGWRHSLPESALHSFSGRNSDA